VTRLALLLVVLAACGKDARPGDEIIARLADLTNEMCACKDRACADAVAVEHRALQDRARTVYRSLTNLPKENVNRIVLLNNQLERCRNKVAPREGEPTIEPAPQPPAEAGGT